MTTTDTRTQPGVLEVLSVSEGDIKLTFDEGDADKANETITRMLKDGYQIFVQTAKGLRRVKKFNPKHNAYVVVESKTNPATASTPTREVPMRGSRARAVGATAGG